MADSNVLKGGEQGRFPGLLLLGLGMAAVVIVAAFIAGGGEWGWPVLILTAICAAAALGYRVLAGSNRDDADPEDNVPKQPATEDRPLGDTPEAHDELNAHDLPKDNPARDAAEEGVGTDGTTRGPVNR